MLNIKFEGKQVAPMRSDTSAFTFSASDVPHGTDSCIYKSAKTLRELGVSLEVALPMFSESEIEAMESSHVSAISMVVLFDAAGVANSLTDDSLPLHLQTELFEPSSEAIEKFRDDD